MSSRNPSQDDPITLADFEKWAARISELQRGFTSAREERTIVDIFLRAAGATLTALKNAIDGGDEYHTLHQLIYHDIDDDKLRTQLIAHFQSHGTRYGDLKILSDIDDTLYCNWLDTRYPKKTVYPGVRALYRELDIGNAESGRSGDLAFLTARPYERFGITDRITHKMLHGYGVHNAMILAGDFLHLLTNQLIAEAKYQRFREFHPLYPEYEYVFLGDSGQGDVTAGKMMLDHDAVRAVFIHDVVNTSESARAEHRQQRIFFHDTYIDAATRAFELGLISRAGLHRVATIAVDEFRQITFQNPAQREAMADLLRRDLMACNDKLTPELRIDLDALRS